MSIEFQVPALTGSPVEAAAGFHANVLPTILERLRTVDELLVVFPIADHSHRAWRLAVVQGLAREHAPVRVNAVASDDPAAVAEAAAFIARAPGVTGQYLLLDGNGAGNPVD